MVTPSYLCSVLMTCTNSWFLNEVKTLTSLSTEDTETDFSHCEVWNKSLNHPHEILPWKHHFFLSLSVYFTFSLFVPMKNPPLIATGLWNWVWGDYADHIHVCSSELTDKYEFVEVKKECTLLVSSCHWWNTSICMWRHFVVHQNLAFPVTLTMKSTPCF